jgi:hypothetical protein
MDTLLLLILEKFVVQEVFKKKELDIYTKVIKRKKEVCLDFDKKCKISQFTS